MSIPVTATTWTSAALPLVALAYLLVGRRWSTIRAAAVGMVLSLAVAAAVFRAPPELLLGESLKGLWSSLSIIAVIVSALFIYETSGAAGGFGAVQRELARLAPNQLLQIMILGRCFSSFLQGPSGFGVPVAVTAPLLIGIGVKPFWAVIVPLMTHSWANTFGTLALAWDTLAGQTGLAGAAYWSTAWQAGMQTGSICLMTGLMLCWFYNGWKGIRLGWPAAIILTAIQAGGQLALTQINTTLCAVVPTAAALGVSFLLGKMKRYSTPDPDAKDSPMLEPGRIAGHGGSGMSMRQAFFPYYFLTAVSVVILLCRPVREVLESWSVAIAFPATRTGYGFENAAVAEYAPMRWLTHPSFFLALAGAVAFVSFRSNGFLDGGQAGKMFRGIVRRSLPASFSVAFLLVTSKVMAGSGQIDVLAGGMAGAVAGCYPAMAPAIGIVGAFISSSNVSSNILFGQFQESMAAFSGARADIILAAQTAGGAAGSMFAPTNVLLAITAAGMKGEEGAIIKKLCLVVAGIAVILGIATAISA